MNNSKIVFLLLVCLLGASVFNQAEAFTWCYCSINCHWKYYFNAGKCPPPFPQFPPWKRCCLKFFG